MLEIIEKNIVLSDSKYIAHQCNCLTTDSAGVAKAIFNAFPYANTYRTRNYSHYKEAKDVPGTIEIFGDGKEKRYVINMYAQLFPGFPKIAESTIDGYKAREKSFEQCLDKISEIDNIESISFPYFIGCGLAHGNWENYEKMLEDFSNIINGKVFLYKYER